MLAAAIREHVRQACEREENALGAAFFEEHLVVVADCACRLASCLGADRDAVELAAYLHDFSAVCDPATLPIHAKASADLARRLLTDRGCWNTIIAEVADAIVAHSTPLPIGSASPEAVCLSNADAAARILRPAYWLYFAFRVRNQGFTEGRDWLRLLLEEQWRGLVDPAKDMVRPQYPAAIDLLR